MKNSSVSFAAKRAQSWEGVRKIKVEFSLEFRMKRALTEVRDINLPKANVTCNL